MYISLHTRSSIQSVGFGGISGSPEGPAKKYFHSSRFMLLSPNNICTAITNEKSNLWASNKLQHMLLYKLNIKCSFSILILSSGSSAFSELLTLLLKRPAYHWREYWYIGSMLARSIIEKNKIDALKATGLNFSQVQSISHSVYSLSISLCWISSEVCLLSSRILINSSSSSIIVIA